MRKTRVTARSLSRQNRKKRNRWLKLAALCAIASALSFCVYLLTHSKVFELTEVVYYGNRHLSEGDLSKLMGVRMRRNLLNVSSEEISRRLLSSPWVLDASLRKEFPHRLLVKVVEAEPRAVLNSRGEMSLVDAKGRVLEKISIEGGHFLPVIHFDDPAGDPKAFEEALLLAEAVGETGLAREKGSVEITGAEKGLESLSLRIDGLIVKLGAGDYAEKLARFFEIGEEIKRRYEKVDYVDLRFSNRVVVKPLSEAIK